MPVLSPRQEDNERLRKKFLCLLELSPLQCNRL